MASLYLWNSNCSLATWEFSLFFCRRTYWPFGFSLSYRLLEKRLLMDSDWCVQEFRAEHSSLHLRGWWESVQSLAFTGSTDVPVALCWGLLLGSPVHLNRTNPGEHLPYLRTSIQIAEHLTGVAFPEKSCKEQQQQPIPTQDVLQLQTAHVGCVCYQPMWLALCMRC